MAPKRKLDEIGGVVEESGAFRVRMYIGVIRIVQDDTGALSSSERNHSSGQSDTYSPRRDEGSE